LHSIDQLKIDTPEQIALELPLAGIGSRFLAIALDTLLQFALYFVVGLILFLLIPAGTLAFNSWSLGPAVGVFLIFCIYWGYFAIFEVLWKGQTPGKRVAGIRVIKESGRPINAYEAIGRNLMRAIDILPTFYGVGLVCMILNKQNRRLGDFVAGTVVVHDKLTDQVRPEWNTAAPVMASTITPQLAEISTEELILIETYLHRRYELEPTVRYSTAVQIDDRVREKTELIQHPGQSLDDYLESAARHIRDSARFR